jgi:hypothetical protein
MQGLKWIKIVIELYMIYFSDVLEKIYCSITGKLATELSVLKRKVIPFYKWVFEIGVL